MKIVNSKPEVLVICGPTASGKTALALKLANAKPTSIISADSRQVYQGLDVLTGKDIPENPGDIRFFGFDLIRPDQFLNAAEYSEYARKIITAEIKKKRQVFVVGGTGFYLKALTEPGLLASVPPDEILRKSLSQLSVEELKQKLGKINPQKFNSLNHSDANNPRRLIRAIEIALSPIATPTGSDPVPADQPSFSWIGIHLPLEVLQERIRTRVASRFATAVSEVEQLLAQYPDRFLPVYTSLGIKPLVSYLSGEIDRQTCHDLWSGSEISYAKRQLTWFAKQPQIIWYDQDKL